MDEKTKIFEPQDPGGGSKPRWFDHIFLLSSLSPMMIKNKIKYKLSSEKLLKGDYFSLTPSLNIMVLTDMYLYFNNDNLENDAANRVEML